MPFEMDESIPIRWNKAQWLNVFSSHSPTIRKVTEYLGLGLSASSSNTNRGIPKFDAPEFRKLSSEVTRLSKDLPKDRDALLDVATDGRSLEGELDALLEDLGPAIWGRDADRSRLLTADPSNRTYPKDLIYEVPEDREIIKTHVHRWIVIKACYYIRNQKLKRYSAHGESEVLHDVDAADAAASPTKPQLLSPNETPQTGTPAPEPSAATPDGFRPINDKKRKSDAYLEHSDRENTPRRMDTPPPAKRPYSSATVPILRKSPRKSLSYARLDTENIPPVPSLSEHRHASTGSPIKPDDVRPMLSPVSSSAVNGTPKLDAAPPRPDSFPPTKSEDISTQPESIPPRHESLPARPAPVPSTSGGFTAVNNQSGRLVPSPTAYTSPYSVPQPNPQHATSGSNGAGTQPTHAPQNSPGLPNGTSFQAVNPAQNGMTARHSPNSQHPSHATLAPKPANQTPPQPSHAHIQPQPQPQPPPQHQPQPHHQVQHQSQPPPPGQHQSQHQPQPQPQSQTQHQPQPQHQSHTQHPTSHQPQHQPHHHPQHQPHHQTQPQPHHQPQHQHQYQHQPDVPTAPPHGPGRVVLPSNAPKERYLCTSCGKDFSTDSNLQRHIREKICTQNPVHAPFPGFSAYGPPPPAYSSPNFSPRPQVQEVPTQVPRPHERPQDMDLLRCELLGDLMKFLHPPKNEPRPDEPTLLHKLETIWSQSAPIFQRQMGQLFESQGKVLHAWIEERRKISQLTRAMEDRPGVPQMEMIDRLLAMNDLRVMRLKWKGMKTHDGVNTISPEDLLCRTFATMTKTEGTEYLFQNGLDALNESVFGFLKSEDMKISMLKR